uniref:Uncharacterized protein n=1 Tax=Glossina brevipalpis TaxID=37001 RepID=A0A1A9X4M8_9MUSC
MQMKALVFSLMLDHGQGRATTGVAAGSVVAGGVVAAGVATIGVVDEELGTFISIAIFRKRFPRPQHDPHLLQQLHELLHPLQQLRRRLKQLLLQHRLWRFFTSNSSSTSSTASSAIARYTIEITVKQFLKLKKSNSYQGLHKGSQSVSLLRNCLVQFKKKRKQKRQLDVTYVSIPNDERNQTKPNQTKPNQTRPDQAKPNHQLPPRSTLTVVECMCRALVTLYKRVWCMPALACSKRRFGDDKSTKPVDAMIEVTQKGDLRLFIFTYLMPNTRNASDRLQVIMSYNIRNR